MQQQQRMLEAMDAELQRMKAGQAAAPELPPTAKTSAPRSLSAQEGAGSVPATASAAKPAARSPDRLSCRSLRLRHGGHDL